MVQFALGASHVKTETFYIFRTSSNDVNGLLLVFDRILEMSCKSAGQNLSFLKSSCLSDGDWCGHAEVPLMLLFTTATGNRV